MLLSVLWRVTSLFLLLQPFKQLNCESFPRTIT